jgi:hypothetical protein
MSDYTYPGIYRHYTGGLYYALFCGNHTETEEEFVIYHRSSDPSQIWIRPKSMFENKEMYLGEYVKRFTRFI